MEYWSNSKKCSFAWLVVLTILLTMNLLFAQEYSCFGNIMVSSEHTLDSTILEKISDDFQYETFTDSTSQILTRELMMIPAEEGYLFPIVSLVKINPVNSNGTLFINPVYKLQWNEQVLIDTLIFHGNEKTSSEFLNREFRDISQQLYSQKTAEFVKNSLKRYSFVEVDGIPEIVKFADNGFGLIIPVKENKVNEFSGVLGYVPATKILPGYFTGNVDIKLMNISGRGRQLKVFWARTDRNSQKMDLSFYEPWIFRTRFFGGAGFQQDFRDTLVVIRNFTGELGLRMSGRADLSVTMNRESTIPTVGGKELLGLMNTSSSLAGFKFGYENRDNILNPKRGAACEWQVLSGKYESDNVSNWMLTSELTGGAYIPIKTRWTVASEIGMFGKWIDCRNLTIADQYLLGGARTLRGYGEDFFSGDQVGFLKTELRWLTGNQSRMYLFYDQGFFRYNNNSEWQTRWPHGFGLGMRLESRMGLIGLDYGFGEGDSFTTAKIHLHLSSAF